MNWIRWPRIGFGYKGLEWIGMDWNGLEWIGMDWNGLDQDG